MWVMGLADLFSRLTSTLSLFGQFLLLLNLPLLMFSNVGISWFAILILIFAPSISALAQLGLSRTREYHADLNAVRLTGDPDQTHPGTAASIRSGTAVAWSTFLVHAPFLSRSPGRPPATLAHHRAVALKSSRRRACP